ncbi:MAG: hypothetical protein MR308_02205 [Lachnospiraceae bacterium]|nr:hypothetical protein [Lachnospiraceae bacterium]
MSGNPGKTIKTLALIAYIVEVIILVVAPANFLGRRGGLYLGIILVGSFLSFISNLFLYAFGELVESSQKTAELNQEILRYLKENNRVYIKDEKKENTGKSCTATENTVINDTKPSWIKDENVTSNPISDEVDLEHFLTSILLNIKDYKNAYEIKKSISEHNRQTGEACNGLMKALDKVIINEKIYGSMVGQAEKYVKAYIEVINKQ